MTSTRPRFSLGLAAFAALAVTCMAWAQASQETSGSSEDHGVQLSSIDKTCKPCQDFYHYANGEWLKNNPIPPAYPSWNRFSSLLERNQEHLKGILEKAAADRNAASGSNEQKIGDF